MWRQVWYGIRSDSHNFSWILIVFLKHVVICNFSDSRISWVICESWNKSVLIPVRPFVYRISITWKKSYKMRGFFYSRILIRFSLIMIWIRLCPIRFMIKLIATRIYHFFRAATDSVWPNSQKNSNYLLGGNIDVRLFM